MEKIMDALRFGQYYGFGVGAVPMVDIMSIVSKMPETSRGTGSGKGTSDGYQPGGLYGADAMNSELYDASVSMYEQYKSAAEQAQYDMAMNGETPELRKLYQDSVNGMIYSKRTMSRTTNNVSIRKDQEAQFRTRRDAMSKSMGKPALANNGIGYGWVDVNKGDSNSTIIDKVIGVTNENAFQRVNLNSRIIADEVTGALVPVADFDKLPFVTHNDTKNYNDVLKEEYNKVSSNMTEYAQINQYVDGAKNKYNFGLTPIGGFYVLEHGRNKVGTNEQQLYNLKGNYSAFLNEEQMAQAKQDAFASLKMGNSIMTSSIYNPNDKDQKEWAEMEKKVYADKGYRVYEVDSGTNKKIVYSYSKDNILYKMENGDFVFYKKDDKDKANPLTVKYDALGKATYTDSNGNAVSDKDVALADVDTETLYNNLENKYVEAYLSDRVNRMHDSYKRRSQDLVYSAALRNEPSINGGGGDKKEKLGATYYMASMISTSNATPDSLVNVKGRDGQILGLKVRYSTIDRSVNSNFTDPVSPGSSSYIKAEPHTTQAYINVGGTQMPLKIAKNGKSFLSDYGAEIVNVTGTSVVLPQVQTYEEMQSFAVSTIPKYLGISTGNSLAYDQIFGTAQTPDDIAKWRRDSNTPFYVPGNDQTTMLVNAEQIFGKGSREELFITRMYTSSRVPYSEYLSGVKTLDEATAKYASELQSYNFYSDEEIGMLTQFFAISAATKKGLTDPSNLVNEFTYSNTMLSGPVKIMYGANKYIGQENYLNDKYNRIYQIDDVTPAALSERNNNAQMAMFGETYQITFDRSNENDYKAKISGLPIFVTKGKGEKVSMTIGQLNTEYGGIIDKIYEKSGTKPLADAINEVLKDEITGNTAPMVYSPYVSYANYATQIGKDVNKVDNVGSTGSGNNAVISTKNNVIYLTGYFNHSLDFTEKSVSFDEIYGDLLMQSENTNNKLSGYLIGVSKNKK